MRTGKLAARIYAPLGTRMSLGDYVRLARTFLEAFKTTEDNHDSEPSDATTEDAKTRAQLRRDLTVSSAFE